MDSAESLYSPGEFGARYLQCLESFSFASIARNWFEYGQPIGVTPEKYFERIVKIHALCGGRIVIMSTSPVGSAPLLALFAQPSFVKFLRRFPGFLELCCTHDGDVDYNNDKNLRAKQVLTGLHRTQERDWRSSMSHGSRLSLELSTASMRHVAEIILRLDPASNGLDVAKAEGAIQSALEQNNSSQNKIVGEDMKLLKAVPKVIAHFINNTETIVSRRKVDYRHRPVSQVLAEALSTGILVREETALLCTVKYIKERCGGVDASFSQIISTTDQASDINEQERRRYLETACYAYNVDLVHGIGAAFGSYVQLGAGVPVGLCFDRFDSIVLESDEPAQVTKFRDGVAAMVGFEFNLDMVTWSHIEAAMSRPAIARSAVEFQGHLEDLKPDYNNAVDVLSRHARQLAEFFIEQSVPVDRNARLLMKITKGLGIILGYGAKLAAESFGKQALSGTAIAMRLAHQAVLRSPKYIVADILRVEGTKNFRLKTP